MFEKEKLIDIASIDLDNIKYRISSDCNIDNLKASIKDSGLINSCIIRKKDNKYIIVSGHKRVISLKELGFSKISSKVVIEKKNIEETELFCSKLSIIENAFHRELNMIEQARGVSLLSRFWKNEVIAINSQLIFNVNLNKNIVDKLLKIEPLISSNKTIYDLIYTNKLSMNTTLKICGYESQVINAFINIFQKVKMGQNKQSEIILNFHEISKRENIPLSELLKSQEVLEILDHVNPDENYKGNLLRSCLNKKRFPELTKAYENHKKGIKDLKLEPEISLNPPENYEGEKYSLSFEFRNKQEFEKKAEKLLSICKIKAFENLIK